MDTQKEKKHGAIGLGALGALLGSGAVVFHKVSKKNNLNAPTQQMARRIRNVAGVGAVGAGVGGALLAAKYYKNKKKGVVE